MSAGKKKLICNVGYSIEESYLCPAKIFVYRMLIIEVKETESIDRALKRYKRKVQNVRLIQELRRRKEFVKPSVSRRNEILKAVYKTKKQSEE
ncbi:MAG: 30S ribosomal protein S21 [Saprospiraceae bacterium]|nr:30S ribosomal protein S21 [Saprospiraceae bacterium]